MGSLVVLIPPVPGAVRSDAHGDGHFRAPRGTRLHRGVDLVVEPGDPVYSPCAGRVARIGICYRDTTKYKLVEIIGADDDVKHRALYVSPRVAGGDMVHAGDVIGLAQDLRERYDDQMAPHVHWEVAALRAVLDWGVTADRTIWLDPLSLIREAL